MPARAIWKGVVRFADIELPVKLYSAVEDRKVHFRLLAADAAASAPAFAGGKGAGKRPGGSQAVGSDASPARVQQRMVDPRSGDPVEREEIRKGFEVEPGVFVVLEPEELEALEPEASRDIQVTRFVDRAEINHQWYERPYYLGPDDGEAATRDYFALAEVLSKQEKEGVARWVMRKKSYVGALHPEGDHLMLIALRNAAEVISASALDAPRGRTLEAKEIGMAQQLIGALEGDFDPERYQDEYRERVLELVEAKAEGRTIELPEAEPPAEEPEDLMGALEASIARFKGEAKPGAKPQPAKRGGSRG